MDIETIIAAHIAWSPIERVRFSNRFGQLRARLAGITTK